MFHNCRTFFAIAMILGLLCSGCAHDPLHFSKTPSMKELCTTIKEPANVQEFLVNLKFLLDDEILLSPDFYDDECVKRFFGGSRVESQTDRPTGKARSILGQPFLFVQLDRYWNQGVDVVWRRVDSTDKEAVNGRIKAGGGISFTENPGFTIDEVIKIFGTDMKIENQYIPGAKINHDPWGRYIRPGNHVHGYKRVTYTFNKPESVTLLIFFVAHNGEIEYTHFRAEENK